MDASPPGLLRTSAAALAAAGGWTVGAVFGAVGRLRRGKPLHPRGRVYGAQLTSWGASRPWGVPLLDAAGEWRCVVRISRAMGLPEGVRDIHGVAVRLPGPDRPADLLFATTGTGRLTRYLLLLRRSGREAMTTLLPVRTAAGAIQLQLVPAPADAGQQAWVVSAAGPRDSRWEPVGRLVADALPVGPDPDPPLRFDPVHNLPEGMSQYRWVRLVRDPSYVLARRWSPSSTWRRSRHARRPTRRDTRTSA